MCWICDQKAKSRLVETQSQDGFGSVHFQAAAGGSELLGPWAGRLGSSKYYDAFPADGVGDKLTTQTQDPADLLITAAIVDEVPNDASTPFSLTVDGPRLISTINTPGDEDWFRVELQAGVTYEFGEYGTSNGDSGVKLPDAWIEIYDADGNRLAFSDGGSPNDSIGLDALLTFTAPESGTYYVNARAFDDVPLNGDTGDFVGDYEVFARVSRYNPYYDLDSVLHSLDWGTQFDGTSRNPDGAEGPRPTGNPVENKLSGKNEIYVYFAREGEVFVDNAADPLNLTTTIVAQGVEPWEKSAFNYVFAEYEKVADIDYIETDNRWEADIVVVTYSGTPGPGVSLLGRMSPPDTPSEGQTEYNAGDERWTQEGLAPGGFYFGTLIHEFGHGHGMSHPHDNGGRSSIMRDENTESGYVEETSPFNYTLGTGNLNQGVYTMMSYMDGWQLSPYGQASSDAGYGYIGSLMALDIAVMQDKYGVNEEWATGNDTYFLADENVTAQFDENNNITRDATSYKSIWDAAGVDRIVYAGARDANIDLRPATLRYEEGGGGWVSYAFGIYGGFTIANGVTIENAYSGSGNDTLTGNDAVNLLSGGAGNDVLDGLGGDDKMEGGLGNDTYYVDSAKDQIIEKANHGTDTIVTDIGYVVRANVENLTYTGTAGGGFTGNELNNVIDASSATGTVVANGADGHDKVFTGSGDDTLYGGTGNDNLVAGAGNDRLNGGDGDDRLQGDDGNDVLIGGAGNDRITGGNGNDQLNGGAGADVLGGGGGGDEYIFDDTSVDGSADQITNFKSSEGDKVRLRPIDADTNTAGNQDFTFVGAAAFSNTAGEFRLEQLANGDWLGQGDVNGDGIADLSILFANPGTPITQADFIF